MAVYTDISDVALQGFLDAYDIGEATSFKGIAEGVSNSNFYLATPAGQFILTLYEKRIEEGDLPYFLALLEHMSARGVTCPMPIHGRDGETIRTLCGRKAALFSFLDGLSPKQPLATHCAEAGRVFAQLHRAGDDFALRRPNALSLAGWRTLADATAARADEVAVGLGRLIADELRFLEASWPNGLPGGVVHADLFPDNALFVGSTLTGVIDFYFACDDAYAYDVAIGLNAWCFDGAGAFDRAKGAALATHYVAERALSAAELEAMPVLARGAALRFLLTRLYDWLNQDAGALVRPKDPLECLGALRFHQTVRSATDYGF